MKVQNLIIFLGCLNFMSSCSYMTDNEVIIINSSGHQINDVSVEYAGSTFAIDTIENYRSFTIKPKVKSDGAVKLYFSMNGKVFQKLIGGYVTQYDNIECNITILESDIVGTCIDYKRNSKV